MRAVDPDALITGPVSYGWEGYETLQNAPDSTQDGNFLNWYMQNVHAADTAAGTTLVNDLDLHWYPEATGGGVRITGTETTPAVVAAREQAPRSLWDAELRRGQLDHPVARATRHRSHSSADAQIAATIPA